MTTYGVRSLFCDSLSDMFPSASFATSSKLFTTFPYTIKSQVIVYPYDMGQSDWVRCIAPLSQFMGPNDFQVVPSVTQIICSNKEALKQTRAVILQKPTAPGRAQIALYYAKLKKECGFKLVTDLDDLQWDLSPVIASYAKQIPNHDQMMLASLMQVLPLFDVVVCSTRYLASRIKSDLGVNAVVMPNGISKSLFGMSQRTSAFTGKPKVMYAGSLEHFTAEIPGDLESVWIPWIRKHIEDGSIDFQIFGEPDFLKDLDGKYTKIPYTNFMQFAATAASYKPDFSWHRSPPTISTAQRATSSSKKRPHSEQSLSGAISQVPRTATLRRNSSSAQARRSKNSTQFLRNSAIRKNLCRRSTGSTKRWTKSTGRTKIRNSRKSTSRHICKAPLAQLLVNSF